jgi:hypothetical protein
MDNIDKVCKVDVKFHHLTSQGGCIDRKVHDFDFRIKGGPYATRRQVHLISQTTLDHCLKYVDDIITVTNDEIAASMKLIWSGLKEVV